MNNVNGQFFSRCDLFTVDKTTTNTNSLYFGQPRKSFIASSKTIQKLPIVPSVSPGQIGSINIKTKDYYDFLSKVVLCIQIQGGSKKQQPQHQYQLAHRYITTIDFILNNTKHVTFTPQILEYECQLNLSETKYKEYISCTNNPDPDGWLYIPLPLWFCKQLSSALPLFCMNSEDDINISVKFSKDTELPKLLDAHFMCTFHTLTSGSCRSAARNYIMNNSHEYIITKYQEYSKITPPRFNGTVELEFNHCVHGFIWTIDNTHVSGRKKKVMKQQQQQQQQPPKKKATSSKKMSDVCNDVPRHHAFYDDHEHEHVESFCCGSGGNSRSSKKVHFEVFDEHSEYNNEIVVDDYEDDDAEEEEDIIPSYRLNFMVNNEPLIDLLPSSYFNQIELSEYCVRKPENNVDSPQWWYGYFFGPSDRNSIVLEKYKGFYNFKVCSKRNNFYMYLDVNRNESLVFRYIALSYSILHINVNNKSLIFDTSREYIRRK